VLRTGVPTMISLAPFEVLTLEAAQAGGA